MNIDSTAALASKAYLSAAENASHNLAPLRPPLLIVLDGDPISSLTFCCAAQQHPEPRSGESAFPLSRLPAAAAHRLVRRPVLDHRLASEGHPRPAEQVGVHSNDRQRHPSANESGHLAVRPIHLGRDQ